MTEQKPPAEDITFEERLGAIPTDDDDISDAWGESSGEGLPERPTKKEEK
jgi:hypothetical protein